MTTTSGKTTRQLLGELFAGIKGLARQRIDEAKAERAVELEVRRRAPVQIGLAVGVTLVGGLLAAQTLALVLVALGVPSWLGHAVVAAVALVAGIVLLRRMPSPGELDSIPEAAIKRIGEDVKELAVEVKQDVKAAAQRHAAHQLQR